MFHQPLEENTFGYVWLELELFGLAIVGPALSVELTAESSDDGLDAGVGKGESTGCHPADEAAWVENDHAASALAEGDCGDDTRGGSSVDTDIGCDDWAAREWRGRVVIVKVWVIFRVGELCGHDEHPILSKLSKAATSFFQCSR
jgi:hypothetical protein